MEMDGHDVLVQSRMLPEGLVAGRILRTTILLPSIMGCQMPPETRSCHKGLSTARSVADVVSDHGMGALDVMVEMGGTEKRLLTAVMIAFENSLIVVGAQVLL